MEKKIIIKDFCKGEKGDFVKCSDCEEFMVVPFGADTCPGCGESGCLSWASECLGIEDLQECSADEAKETIKKQGLEAEIVKGEPKKIEDNPKYLYFVHKVAKATYTVEKMEAGYILDKDALERGYGKKYNVKLTRKGVIGYMERGRVDGKESEINIWDGTAFTSKTEAEEYASRRGFEEL